MTFTHQTSGELKPMNCLFAALQEIGEEEDGKHTDYFEIASLWEFDMDDNNEATSSAQC
jgi:hypothetical protein